MSLHLKVVSVPKSAQTTHGILPLPVLSQSSRPHLCTNPTLVFLDELHDYVSLMFCSIRTGLAHIASYQAFWLGSYFVLNLVLTLYNKILLVSFPYPYSLTAIHAIFGLVGGTCLRLQNVYQPKSLWGSDYVLLLAFSLLYSINIAVSNASLDLVTVPVRPGVLCVHLMLKRIQVSPGGPRYNTVLHYHFLMATCQRTFQPISTFFDVSCYSWGLSCYLWRLLLHGLGFRPYSLWNCPSCSQNTGDSRNSDSVDRCTANQSTLSNILPSYAIRSCYYNPRTSASISPPPPPIAPP